eukprot:CAMPEP_0206284016 /NCGR_PEP_ID=MMETSP0047_2-20121206/40540_1 /ASSEMBLY_ACC=CAM_ASM_000192 /TAXON_ID=195065 /ORGANISM="Chroomonas mesostigmatica_cf, Strain CCMP1168" /LENGTH=94 /DNA_ID=CAMNT_0053714423 /DNA_START=1225 /DNA_END=1509 /DNA_ORIENTATION=+
MEAPVDDSAEVLDGHLARNEQPCDLLEDLQEAEIDHLCKLLIGDCGDLFGQVQPAVARIPCGNCLLERRRVPAPGAQVLHRARAARVRRREGDP